MDALSDVLKSVHLEGAVYLNAEFTAPWSMRGKYGMASVRARLAGAEHVVFFHYLTEGRCKVKLAEGVQVMDVTAGDLVLFPQDDRHLMGSDLHAPPLEADNLTRSDEIPDDLVQLRHGGGGGVTRFVCGYLACSRSTIRPLLDGLPRVLRIPIGDGQASTLAKLAELMFVEALRRYVEMLPPGGKGWLAGLRDPQIGRALALIHREPGRAWTVEQLAREVALSRSALAERFATLVGESPIQYLMRWRLALAAQMLRSGRDAVTRVAERSGYDSEAAFSRAFKREFGMPPTVWRKAGAA